MCCCVEWYRGVRKESAIYIPIACSPDDQCSILWNLALASAGEYNKHLSSLDTQWTHEREVGAVSFPIVRVSGPELYLCDTRQHGLHDGAHT